MRFTAQFQDSTKSSHFLMDRSIRLKVLCLQVVQTLSCRCVVIFECLMPNYMGHSSWWLIYHLSMAGRSGHVVLYCGQLLRLFRVIRLRTSFKRVICKFYAEIGKMVSRVRSCLRRWGEQEVMGNLTPCDFSLPWCVGINVCQNPYELWNNAITRIIFHFLSICYTG